MAFWTKQPKQEEEPNELTEDAVNINFAPLWEDEEPSGLLQMVLPIAQIIILIYIAVVVHGLK